MIMCKLRLGLFGFLLALMVSPLKISAGTLDTNFTETTYASAGGQLTGLAWAPDGSRRLFVSRKTGEIMIIKNGATLPTPFATVSPVFLNSECGLIGICFDHNFILNGYVYVFVTVSSSEQQIIRYTAVGDIGTNKTILVPGLPTLGQNHDGGGIGVGHDGKLYWAVGDNGNGTGVDGNMTSLASKVGRANLNGTVPVDNPFIDGPGGTNDYIWARGFRNPFTLNFQPRTGKLWVNCVGASYEQVFLVHARDHAGWDNFENNQPAGYITPKIKYRTNGTDTRSLLAGTGAVRSNNIVTFTTGTTHGFRQGEKITISGVADTNFNGAYFVVSTPSATVFTVNQPGTNATSGGGNAVTLNQGGVVNGGCFFESTGVPTNYRGNFIYGDFNSGRVMRAVLLNDTNVLSVDYFGTNITQYIDGAVGPDGALYYGGFGGTVYRLAYNFSQQTLVVTPTVLRMFEGGRGAFAVRLAMAPPGEVTVNVSRTSGDADLTVFLGSSLTFNTTNWSIPQVVQLEAASDLDSIDDVATFTVASTGLTDQTMDVSVLDLTGPPGPFSVGPIGRAPGGATQPMQIGITGETGRTYILEASTDLTPPWVSVSTNTLVGTFTNVIDSESTNLSIRFYRARLP